jgi:ribosomal protein S18 acetylase RimI-like enzyme
MTEVTYRLIRRDELLSARKLLQRSFNHLMKKNNRPTDDRKITAASPFYHHIYSTDSRGFWGAFKNGKLIGFGHALLRGKQWYLANLFIDPGRQAEGIGRELLKRCLKYGRGRVESYSLCTFSHNEAALALYSSFGLMPVYPIFAMNKEIGKNFRIRSTGLKVLEDKSEKSILRINRLEKKIRGYSHLVDLRYFARNGDYRIFQFYKDSRWVGYSVVFKNALMAPAGSPYRKYLSDIITETVRQCARSGSKEVGLCFGAGNGDLFERLKKHGFKIVEMVVFLSTKPYSDLSRYVPADLGLY